MAKEKFDRSKNMPILVLSVTLTMVKQLNSCYRYCISKNGDTVAQSYDMIDNAPEEKERGITINTAHMSIKLTNVTMLTLTAQDTLTMLKT